MFLLQDKPLTAAGIRRSGQAMADKIHYIRTHYAADEVALLSFSSYKHLAYYLPADYTNLWVDLFSREAKRHRLPPSVHYVLIVDNELQTLERHDLAWESIALEPGVEVQRLELPQGYSVLYGSQEIGAEADN
jgi:hypothetical protein